MQKPVLALFSFCFIAASCAQKTIGSIERIDKDLDKLIKQDAKVEIIAEGYEWTEGPVWIDQYKMLLFSDIPKNTVYKWTEAKGAELYLTPSGLTGNDPRGGETGSNGLIVGKDGKLLLAQHGDRRIGQMNAPLNAPKPSYISIANNYSGKKFNSPNDLVQRSNGDIFFTDPPYGLEKNMEDPKKELPFQGVYKVSKDGTVSLLIDSIARPNGIALTPDEKTLIIANSEGSTPRWYAYDFGKDDKLVNPRLFGGPSNEKGGADGLKIDKQGNVFATGPGGVWIFNKEGKLLGKIKIPEATSNTALSADEKTLFITADMYVLRLKMR